MKTSESVFQQRTGHSVVPNEVLVQLLLADFPVKIRTRQRNSEVEGSIQGRDQAHVAGVRLAFVGHLMNRGRRC